jgi:hypothetical protein
LVELKDGVSMTSAYGVGFNPVNAYIGSGGWTYKNSSVASLYQNGAGTHEWSRAASGTAGTAVTWISQLKTDSSDNVIVPTGNLVIDTSGKGVVLPGGITWTSGSGSPEGVVTAPVGSLYSRSDGGLLTSLYVKQSGSGNTGWVGK